MSVIFPGNYVAHLNAYREQGCVALPGVEFYRGVGALVLNPDNDSVLLWMLMVIQYSLLELMTCRSCLLTFVKMISLAEISSS